MPVARPSKKRDDMYRDRRRRKVCAFCADKTAMIDYKEINRLRRYLSERAKIEPRRKTGTWRCPPTVGPRSRAPASAGSRAEACPSRGAAAVRPGAPARVALRLHSNTGTTVGAS